MSLQCNSCGFANPTGMNFCGSCAAPLLLICKQCQFKNPPDFNYCGSCGTDIHLATGRRRGDLTSHESNSDIDSAERRQLTVFFCDVVGSSTLSESVDPEELREIMQKYRKVSDAAVKKYNGYTAQYLGDGILAYFGYPKANEDDAQRAVCAGLQLVQDIRQLNQPLSKSHQIELHIRVGIHTGLVVVGDMSSNRQNNLALGTTPNIAARIQDYAKPNTVIISQNTFQLVQHQFELKALGEQRFKGFSSPICVYQAVTSLDVNRWLAQKDREDISPLIGRKQESALLLDRLEQSIAGTGQAVLLNGEAGIGKSRLTQYIRENLAEIPHQMIECWGTPQYQNSYLHCIIIVLRQLWNLDQLSSSEQQLESIETSLKNVNISLTDSVPLLADLMGIELACTHYEPCHLPAAQKKSLTLEILLTLFTSNISEHVTVLIAEDLHWIDPTTLELLGLIIDQVPTYKFFVLLTFRLEFTPPWQARSHLTQISLNRLTRKQSSKLVSWITQQKKLPAEIFQQIIDKTDGIPFFVEELTQMILRSDVLIETGDHYTLRNSMTPLQIPSTLQDSLMARLDSLGPEKELAQISAIVGREFSQDLLQAVMIKQKDSKPNKVKDQLSNLVYSELLYQRNLPPGATYIFRHALVHEAAYQSLLIKTRHKYHRLISELLAEKFPNIVEENPELIAYHCANGGDHLNAIKYLIIAVDIALTRSAIVDAIIHLGTGLKCIDKLKQPRKEKLALELGIQARLAKAYVMIRGYGDSAVVKCYTRAKEISEEISDSEQNIPILMGLWEYYVVRAEMEIATDLATKINDAANYLNESNSGIEAKRIIGSTLFWKGQLAESKSYLLQGTSDSTTRSKNNAIFTVCDSPNQDPVVAGLSNLSCLLWLTGHADQSLDTANQAVEFANNLNHPFSQAYAHLFRAVVLHLRGDVDDLAEETKVLIDISTQYNFLFWQITATMLQIWSQYQSGRSSQSIDRFEQALKQYQATGSRLALSYYKSMLADLYCSEKKYAEALSILDSTIDDGYSRGDLFFTPELIRMKANTLYAMTGNNIASLELLDQADNLAKKQGANSIQLRIAISRHELLYNAPEDSQNPANYMEIRNLLTLITEGQNCRDIQAAKRISASLQEISPQLDKSLH